MALTFNQVKPTTVSQEQVPAPKNETGMANVTIRVDADCFLLCDGEFMEEIEIVANKITKDTLIMDIVKINPEAVGILQSYGMHCLGCPAAQGESLEEACAVHGIDVESLIEKLNA